MKYKIREAIINIISWATLPVLFGFSLFIAFWSVFDLQDFLKDLSTTDGIFDILSGLLNEMALPTLSIFPILLILVGLIYTILSLIVRAGKKKIIFSIGLTVIGVILFAGILVWLRIALKSLIFPH